MVQGCAGSVAGGSCTAALRLARCWLCQRFGCNLEPLWISPHPSRNRTSPQCVSEPEPHGTAALQSRGHAGWGKPSCLLGSSRGFANRRRSLAACGQASF